MIKPIVNGTKVVFGPCRQSYVYLFSKFTPDGGSDATAKYMTSALIPENERETIAAIRKAIEAARQQGIVSKWGGKEPKKLELPLRDGNDREKDAETYAGHLYINAKCSTRPGVVDRDRNPIMDEEDVYSGMWAILSVTFYPYDSNGNKGVACGLNNVMKFKDDERLGGRASAAADFNGVNFADTEDDEDL